MKKLYPVLASLIMIGTAAATVQVGPSAEVGQPGNNFYFNFSQNLNFSYLDTYSRETDLGGSNFSGRTIPYDPVAYYPLDGSGEDLVGENDITGGTAPTAEGVDGEPKGARYFDGSSYLRVENPEFGISDSQSVTISMWQKGDGQPAEDTSFAGHDAAGNNRQVSTHAPWSDENIYWDTTETFDGDGSRISGRPSGSVNWDEWHHYLFVHNANTGRKEIWFDGNMIASSSSETQQFEEIVDFYIGAADAGNNGYTGRIDNFAVFNRSLSTSEISEVYGNPSGRRTGATLDFYEPNAGLQEYVSNYTVETDTNSPHFRIGNLPGSLFYEAFNLNTGKRYYIGYTDGDEFNFTIKDISSAAVSVFHYGEKGVAVNNVTFNDSDPDEDEAIGVESGIFNEGVVDDESTNKTLTISTYNGSGWQQKQYRSEDIGVPIENTKTEQSQTALFEGSFTNTTQYRNGGGQVGLGYPNGTPSDNLVGYWRMDDAVSGTGGTIKDYSGENNDGTATGGVATGSEGILSTNSFTFDSTDQNDYVEITGSPELNNICSGVTVSAWIKPKDISQNKQGIFEKSIGGSLNSQFLLFTPNPSNSKIRFRIIDGGTKYEVNTDSHPGIDGEWHKVTGTYNGSELRIYFDGELEGTTSHSGDIDCGNGKSRVGEIFADFPGWYGWGGSLDEVLIYNKALSSSEIKNLYFHGAPFNGSYSTKKIDNDVSVPWYQMNVDANIPSDTSLNADFRAINSTGGVEATQSFTVQDGDRFYNITVPDTEDAEIVFTGSSSNITKSWEINSLKVYSGGPYRDNWKAKPGPWRFVTNLDPNDEVKETDETNNVASNILDVPSHNIFYGGSETKLKLGAGSEEVYIWNPSVDRGNIFFADVDSEYRFWNLEPVGEGNYSEIDETLNLSGHNDSVSELWDPNGDGTADTTKQFEIGQRTLDVPVTDSTSDGSFQTGILYDTADGTPYNGTQDLVFVTEIQDSTEGEYGIYDYEIRVPATLRSLKPGQDLVEIYTEVK